MKHQVAVISDDQKFLVRVRKLADFFNLQILEFVNLDHFMEKEATVKNCSVAILSAVKASNQSDTAGMVQAVKYVLPTSWISVIVEKKVTTEAAQFIKKSGGSVVLLEDDFLTKSKFEFVLAEAIRSDWVPVKSADLIIDVPMPFTLHHLLPLNHKMIPVVPNGQSLDKSKLSKFNGVGEFYIRREEYNSYVKYVAGYNDHSAAGLKRRCRSVYQNFVVTYKSLVMLLTDQSEGASFQEGKELLFRLNSLAKELITSLSAAGEAWDVINNSSLEDVTPIDRLPAIAAYAGMMSLMADIGNPEEVMVCALLADIGLLDVPPQALKKIRDKEFRLLTPEEVASYEAHPIASINMALSRKLPIPEEMKKIILATHERCDEKGFPHRPVPEKIPQESFLIQFCEILDASSLVEFGKPRIKPEESRRLTLEREMREIGKRFPAQFLQKIKAYA